ncbi:MAG: ATP-binding protein, partial [Armatimonadota bacterium]
IAELCRRLDGIPLAIELAAARVKVLSVEQITSRLEDRFRLLTGGTRTGLPHHQTLRAAMDWSYDLLPEDERALFRRLAVFAGSFSLEAAERICAGEGLEEAAVLDLLAHLVDKSLVITEDTTAGDVRYQLLETVRQYALNRVVESGETEAVRGRHRNFFLQLAEQAEPRLLGPDQKVWLDRLEAEHDNFRAALEWSRTDPGGVESGLRLAGALWWFWEVRGYWSEGRQWLKEILSRAGESSTEAHVKALNAAGSLAIRQADGHQASALATRALDLSRQLGDKRGTASCLVILGIYACSLQDYKQAEALGDESLSLSRELGDNWGAAWAKTILALVAREERDYARSTALLEESLAQSRAMGHQWSIAIATLNLGLVARDQGDLERAAALLEEALGIFRQLGDKSFTAYSQLNLGTIASAMSEFGRAGTLYREALAVRNDLGDKRGIATCLAALGCVAAALGQFARAATLFGAAEGMREAIGASIPALLRSEYDRQVAAASAGLGEAAFRAAWAEGRLMSPDAAVEFALAEDAQPAIT